MTHLTHTHTLTKNTSQVEIQCGERGRVLAYTWNAYLSTHEDTMWQINKENVRLIQENNEVSVGPFQFYRLVKTPPKRTQPALRG